MRLPGQPLEINFFLKYELNRPGTEPRISRARRGRFNTKPPRPYQSQCGRTNPRMRGRFKPSVTRFSLFYCNLFLVCVSLEYFQVIKNTHTHTHTHTQHTHTHTHTHTLMHTHAHAHTHTHTRTHTHTHAHTLQRFFCLKIELRIINFYTGANDHQDEQGVGLR